MPRPSIDSDASSPFRRFAKSKKSVESDYNRPAQIISTLPVTDDFRTSLLMTGLSARFSMLREQDDPLSKIGKASDDSVLHPNRQSRIMDFNNHYAGLGDISEVESIRPSFLERDPSQLSDDGQTGSIMNRSRPNDGNNLFGGRQKIYKIAAGSKPGAMGGRAVYDDDVAKSSFQKWRQAERAKTSHGEKSPELPDAGSFGQVSQYDTTSTLSSFAASRDSTSSSLTSQYASSIKDGPSTTVTPSASSSNLERSVTRTRRLYEQGLNKELKDQQSSALSRMDTLSRPRIVTPRAGDVGPSTPSPTLAAYMDRTFEKRGLLSKASAPNLRSFTPPTAGSSPIPPSEPLPMRGSPEKANFGVNPPLSPPISEAEEHPVLPIQPNDRGKATSLGVFSRPQQYDDSKFAQRQRDLLRGRESGELATSDSGSSLQFPRSSSIASSLRTTSDRSDAAALHPDPTRSSTGGDESSIFAEEADARNNLVNLATGFGGHSMERPNDEDHPAFRQSALPTPLTLSSRNSDGSAHSNEAAVATASADTNTDTNAETKASNLLAAPAPPAPSGLSGMVRQHLRHESNTSSIYDAADETEQNSPARSRPLSSRIATATSAWSLTESEYNPDSRPGSFLPPHLALNEDVQEQQDENDPEFARHLADGARRVREKLTSFVDSDSEQASSRPTSESKEPPTPRTNPLGILRSKSSRGSIFDRNRDRDTVESVTEKVPKLPTESPEPKEETKSSPDGGIHAGLRAFRQARRELQKLKENESRQRHQGPPAAPDSAVDRPAMHRAVSNDPIMGQDRFARSRSSDPSEHNHDGFRTGEEQKFTRPRALSRPRGDYIDGPFDNARMGRPRNGSLLAAAASTPNLHAPVGAPPLPPINPRRKTAYGMGRQSAESSPLPSPRMLQSGEGMTLPPPPSDMQADPRRQGMRRVISDNNADRIHMSPPTRRPPLPHGNVSSASMPGGMF